MSYATEALAAVAVDDQAKLDAVEAQHQARVESRRRSLVKILEALELAGESVEWAEGKPYSDGLSVTAVVPIGDGFVVQAYFDGINPEHVEVRTAEPPYRRSPVVDRTKAGVGRALARLNDGAVGV